jgi:hypothetical protein
VTHLKGMFTWTAEDHRVALSQLNLYHEGKRNEDSCYKLPERRGKKDAIEHNMWECPSAQAC